MNILANLDVEVLLLFGILITQVILLMRTPSNTSAHARRQRKARIDGIKAKCWKVIRKVKRK